LRMGLDRKCCVICSSGKIGLILLIPLLSRHSGAREARARNPYPRSRVWIPDSRYAASGMTSWVTRPRTATNEQADTSSAVIPGRAKREPGIHNHDRKCGFRIAAARLLERTSWVTHRRPRHVSKPTHSQSSFRGAQSASPESIITDGKYGFRIAAARLPE